MSVIWAHSRRAMVSIEHSLVALRYVSHGIPQIGRAMLSMSLAFGPIKKKKENI